MRPLFELLPGPLLKLGLGPGASGQILESLRFPRRGRQRELDNSFVCFPSKKLTAKIYHKRLTGPFMK